MTDTDPSMDALVRGVATAQSDAKQATTILRGQGASSGLLGTVETLKAEVRHIDDRVTETRELFSALHRQLDSKMDSVLVAVKAITSHRPHALVTALVVVSIVVLALSGSAIACAAVYAAVEHHEQKRLEATP